MADFDVCQHGQPCRRQPEQHSDIAQRLEDLMRRCREEQHQPTYADLQQVARGEA